MLETDESTETDAAELSVGNHTLISSLGLFLLTLVLTVVFHFWRTHQSVWWNNEQPYQLHQGQKGKPARIHSNPFGGGFVETFSSLFKAVYAKIETPSSVQNYPTFEDGYINAMVCEAIYKSAKNESIWTTV